MKGGAVTNVDWFTELFINEAKHASDYHSGFVGSAGSDDGTQTFILVDENGYELPAVLVDEEVDLTATADDICLGAIAVTDEGIVKGTHVCDDTDTQS